jgi:hypothetical protein
MVDEGGGKTGAMTGVGAVVNGAEEVGRFFICPFGL